MKQLSSRALGYLERMNRDKEWYCSKEETFHYLDTQNLGLIKPVIRFESCYSGYNLNIHWQSSEEFFMRLFSVDDIKDGSEIIYLDYNGRKLFDCGYHQTAQYNFYIDEQGSILVGINDDYYLELFSSAEIMIEIYALFDSFTSNTYRSDSYQIKDVDEIMLTLLYGGYREIKDCCDSQNQILSNGDITVRIEPYWDRGEIKCVSVYGPYKNRCESLIDSFKKVISYCSRK